MKKKLVFLFLTIIFLIPAFTFGSDKKEGSFDYKNKPSIKNTVLTHIDAQTITVTATVDPSISGTVDEKSTQATTNWNPGYWVVEEGNCSIVFVKI